MMTLITPTPARIRLKTMREQAEELILVQILNGTLSLGSQLPPIRKFSAQLGLSFRTVQQALASLQTKGYVSMRQGAGTFVTSAKPGLTMNEAAVLCIETQVHVFGELASVLTRRLQMQGLMPTLVDTKQDGWRDLLIRVARSKANVFVIHGGLHFAYDLFRHPLFEHKHLIGVLDWNADDLAGRMPLAVVDHHMGGEQVAQHLAASGHRRVLLAGSSNILAMPAKQAAGFRAAWTGHLTEITLHYSVSEKPELDVKAAVALFKGLHAPTAVFGLRDFDIISLQQVLAAEGVDLATRCERVGYGNTPWSSYGAQGFSSVDWNLDAIAAETCRFIAEGWKKDNPVRHVAVAPRLMLRGR